MPGVYVFAIKSGASWKLRISPHELFEQKYAERDDIAARSSLCYTETEYMEAFWALKKLSRLAA